MKKMMFYGAVLLCLVGLMASCGKRYDPVKVKGSMTELKAAITDAHKYGNPITTDFVKAKDAFERVEKAFTDLKGTKAPKGDQEEWDFIHEQCILSAQKGAKACELKDKGVIAAALLDLDGALVKGHGRFKK